MNQFDLGDVSVSFDGRELPVVGRPRMVVTGGARNMGMALAAKSARQQSTIIEIHSLGEFDAVMRGVNDFQQIWIDEASSVVRKAWRELMDYLPCKPPQLVHRAPRQGTKRWKRCKRQLAQRLARRAMRKAMR